MQFVYCIHEQLCMYEASHRVPCTEYFLVTVGFDFPDQPYQYLINSGNDSGLFLKYYKRS
jgi:hypothetical protein